MDLAWLLLLAVSAVCLVCSDGKGGFLEVVGCTLFAVCSIVLVLYILVIL